MHPTSFVRIVIGSLYLAALGEAYSWHSTLWELRNLTSFDEILLTNLTKQFSETKVQANRLLTHLRLMRERTKEINSNLHNDDRDKDVAGNYRNWMSKQIVELKNVPFPLTNDVYETYKNETDQLFPKQEDMDAVLKILLGLSKSYKLKAKDLVRGRISKLQTDATLTPLASFRLASLACKKWDMEACLAWSEQALLRTREIIRDYKVGDIDDIVNTRSRNDKLLELCGASVKETYIRDWPRSSLQCFLWNNNYHPRLIVQPVKAEQISISPPVFLFYDVITDKQIEYLKKKATPMLQQATTQVIQKTMELDNHRITHNCWINDWNDANVKNLAPLAQAITGMPALTSAEPLQVAHYGIGGHYHAHRDAIDPKTIPRFTNRDATFMYYLSDVSLGGATAFLDPGVAVRPVKGAALFWRNITPDAEKTDVRTWHGGCPVVLGSKWIANMWIRQCWKSTCRKTEDVFSL